jgi:predicted aspartyl protease
MTGSVLAAIFLGLMLSTSVVASPRNDGPTADQTTALDTDSSGRFTAKVMLDGHGPLDFVVDTGAQSSGLTPQTAEHLKLRQGPDVQLTGTNGSQPSRMVTVRAYRSELFQRQSESMLLIPNATLTSADGFLGMNAFTSGRIAFDFAQRQLTFGPSGPMPEGYSEMAGDVRMDNFLIVDVIVDGVRAKALIDTGDTYPVGNPQLQRALGLATGDRRLVPLEAMYGVTNQHTPTTMTRLHQITLGPVTFARPAIMFSDLPIFHTLDLDTGPSLIIGIDLLSRLQSIAIDYPRAELQLRP